MGDFKDETVAFQNIRKKLSSYGSIKPLHNGKTLDFKGMIYYNNIKYGEYAIDNIILYVEEIKNRDIIENVDMRYNFAQTKDLKDIVDIIDLYDNCKVLNLSENCITRSMKNKNKFDLHFKCLCFQLDYINLCYNPISSHVTKSFLDFLKYNDLIKKVIFIPEFIIKCMLTRQKFEYKEYMRSILKKVDNVTFCKILEAHQKYYNIKG